MTTDSAKKACVFCNGQLENPADVKQIANDCDLLIAADGGVKCFFDIGLTPQVIIGDMDSIESDMWKSKSGIEYITNRSFLLRQPAAVWITYWAISLWLPAILDVSPSLMAPLHWLRLIKLKNACCTAELELLFL